MRPFAPLLLVTALLLPQASAQAPQFGPPAPAAPIAPAPVAPAPAAPAVPATPAPLTLGAPVDTLREYRLTETTRVRYDSVQMEVSGGTPEQAAAFQNQFRAALRAREGERTVSYKQFLKVLPAEGTAGRYLWNTLSTEGERSVSSRSVRTLGAGGGSLSYQPNSPAPDASNPALALLLVQVEAELARTHAELLANFDPASFGLLGTPGEAPKLQPGQTFTRLKTLQPPHPFANLAGQKTLGAPLQVEQQLRLENEQGGELVFFRQARVVQPGQIVSGSAEMILTLSRALYDGELRLTPDGLPVSATRDEAYAVQISGRVKQGDLSATFAMTVTTTSVLTLSPVK